MWITTKFGFFSVNKTPETPARCLQVRARSRADLERLSERVERCGWTGIQIIETPDADYQFRANVSYVAFVEVIGSEIESINYSNFKDEIAKVDPDRAKIYGRVWAVLLEVARPFVGDVFAPGSPFSQRALFGSAPFLEANPPIDVELKKGPKPKCESVAAGRKKKRKKSSSNRRRKNTGSPAV